MDQLFLFIRKTKELKSILIEKNPSQQREEMIQKVEGLLVERQEILTGLQDVLASLNEPTKLELVAYENELQALMEKHQKDIKQDLKTLQLKKQKENQYSNPYENMSIDGMFLDKKK